MRIAYLLLSLLVLVGCTTAGPSPQYLENQAYIAGNKPRAEAGAMKWSEYYTGLYTRAPGVNMPAAVMSRINELIRYAEQYEAGSITKEQFDYQRRAANIANMADSQAEAERQRARRMAAAAAMANTPPILSTYQIVQPRNTPSTSAPLVLPTQQTRGATAFFTGRQEQVQTVTYQTGWKCEYNYAGRTFTRIFTGSCPSSVQVE